MGITSRTSPASERLLADLMTALVDALGLLPIAIRSGDPGRIEAPMVIVILAGFVTSTALHLLILHPRFEPRTGAAR